ncbi:sporulation integral membrane protein YtvI [Paenibacillus sp. J31TS4]|uniref:sporulation integral membrane protein YtvI n=1 Tax=Paenibacillus sp. J31TS4 TaxID=2807195 RepID=UPI001B0C2BF7|nr:sporulation integral membrane protein YtvI [Paenibacillus sp. J31TS4]GIP38273.1 sporulation integral membrane protein YtvI [Paenibacillus sp. J31TS4]
MSPSIKSLLFGTAAIVLLYLLFTVGAPFLFALIVAIFLEPLVLLAMKPGRMNRLMASGMVCTLFTLVLLAISYGLGLKIYTELVQLSRKVPDSLGDTNLLLEDLNARIQRLFESLAPHFAEKLQAAVGSLFNSLSGVLKSASGYVLTFVAGIPSLFIAFLVFLLALYLISMNLPGIKKAFLSVFEEHSRAKMDAVLDNLRQAIFGFFSAQIILSAITYIIMLVGLFILGTPYPLAISLLIVIVDVLPVLGTGSVLVPWAIYCFVVGDTFVGTGLILLFVLVTIVRRIIEPKVLGNAIGISSLSALVSLYVGFQLVGVVGLFLGPVVVILYQAMRKVGLFQFKIKLE